MATHSSILAWKTPWTEEPGTLCPWGCEESDTTERIHFHFSLSCIGEGNPLQCSCLENPRDGGAWWAAVYGVTQSRTQLKRLSSSSRYSLKGCGGTSLIVQWLRISLLMQQTWVRSPHWETKIPHTWEQLSPCTATINRSQLLTMKSPAAAKRPDT